jgi:hypothetical protein
MSLAIVPGADESIKIKADDNKVHAVQDAVEGVRDGTRNVDNEQSIIEDLGARVIDGAQSFLANHPERLYFLGDGKTIRPIASDWGALSRGWSHCHLYFTGVVLTSLQIGFLPPTRPSISTSHAILITREPLYGSPRATPTEGGKNLVP